MVSATDYEMLLKVLPRDQNIEDHELII